MGANNITKVAVQFFLNLAAMLIVIMGLLLLVKSRNMGIMALLISAGAVAATVVNWIATDRKDEKDEIISNLEMIVSEDGNFFVDIEDKEIAGSVTKVKDKLIELKLNNKEKEKERETIGKELNEKFNMVSLIIRNLENMVKEQSKTYNSLVENLEKTSGEIQEITAAANIAAETSQKTLELTSATVELATSGVSNVEKSLTKMGEIKDNTDITSDSVMKLEDKANEIGGIVGAITKISEQTNLLALNAAIEAARAGEAGRGFAVVAQEIRGLAEESRKAAETINKIVEEIQKQTRQAAEKMNKTSEVVTEGSNDSTSVGESLTMMLDAISKINNMMQDVAAGAQEQSANTHEIAGQMEQNAIYLSREADNRSKLIAGIKNAEDIFIDIKDKMEILQKRG
jgi:methyl-accepting chemotaxis protein